VKAGDHRRFGWVKSRYWQKFLLRGRYTLIPIGLGTSWLCPLLFLFAFDPFNLSFASLFLNYTISSLLKVTLIIGVVSLRKHRLSTHIETHYLCRSTCVNPLKPFKLVISKIFLFHANVKFLLWLFLVALMFCEDLYSHILNLSLAGYSYPFRIYVVVRGHYLSVGSFLLQFLLGNQIW